MSKFTDIRDRVENFISSGVHDLWSALAPGLKAGGVDLATKVYHDVATAQGNGAQGKALIDAGLSSLEKNAVTVGVNVALDEAVPAIGALVGHVVQTAPPPPAQ